MNQVEMLTRALEITDSPALIFGLRLTEAEQLYYKLARILHPDAGGTTEGFQLLQAHWENWGQLDFNANMLLREDEICNVTLFGMSEQKVVRNPADMDLLRNEIDVLSNLERARGAHYYSQLFPHAIVFNGGRVSFTYRPLELLPQHLVTLEDVFDFYRGELDIKHLGWIWHRLIWVLGFAHQCGIVHGAVTPANILIGPENHDVILINWYFAAQNGEPLRAISDNYLYLYPRSLLDSNIDHDSLRSLSIPGLDFYMAANTLLSSFRMPYNQPLLEYFQALTRPPLSGVITDPGILNTHFNRIIYDQLHWSYEHLPLPWVNWEEMRNE